MTLEKVALIRFDFALQSDQGELIEGLEAWYGQEPQQFYETHFIGSSGSIEGWKFSTEEPSGENKEESDIAELVNSDSFDSIETTVFRSTKFFLDVITIGIVSRDQVREFIEHNENEGLDTWQEELAGVRNSIPAIGSNEIDPSVIYYIDPGGEVNVWEDDTIGEDNVYKFAEKHEDMLKQFNFSLHGYISLIRSFVSQQLVVPKYPPQVWGPLIAVNLVPPQMAGGEAIGIPEWARFARGFLPFFRAHHWLHHRSNEVSRIDSETYEFGHFLGQRQHDEGSSSYLKLQKDITQVREEWTATFSQTLDELDEVKHSISSWGAKTTIYDQTFSEGVQFGEYRISKPSLTGIQIGDESLLDVYRDHLGRRGEHLEDELQRISQKLERISNFFHDSSNIELQEEMAEATEASLEFQRWVFIFTAVLVVLTIITFWQEITAMVDYVISCVL